MDTSDRHFSRRGLLKGAGAAAGFGALSMLPIRSALGAGFPERNINVYVPTREGGGADRNLRAFTGVWKKYLPTNFEPSFYPGAAGRVGYETYMGKAAADCHDLIFGNMGPEVLNWVVKEPTFPLDSYFYFAQVDSDPAVMFVSDKSTLKTVDDVVAEGKKRTLSCATSRLAHPASLGTLALGAKTGASFNLVPLSGGRNTRVGVTTGEVDFGCLPASSVIAQKNLKIIALFEPKNTMPDLMPDAVIVNDHFGMDLPPLVAGARAFAIKKEAADKYPDRYDMLVSTLEKVFPDPEYKEAVIKTKAPWELIGYGDRKACADYVENITRIGTEYKSLLTGKKS